MALPSAQHHNVKVSSECLFVIFTRYIEHLSTCPGGRKTMSQVNSAVQVWGHRAFADVKHHFIMHYGSVHSIPWSDVDLEVKWQE